jgi:hypothetical protein
MKGGFDEAFLAKYEAEKQALEKAMKKWEEAHNQLDAFVKEKENE